jgi:hypothetical protein
MMPDSQRRKQQIVPKWEEQKRRVENAEDKQARAAQAKEHRKRVIEESLHNNLDTKLVIILSFGIEDVC